VPAPGPTGVPSPGCLTRTGDLRISTGAAGFPAVTPTVPRSTTELSRDEALEQAIAYKLGEGPRPPRPRMRVLLHLRHSLRNPGDPHLSEAGVALARQVGARAGGFDRVLTSPKLRAVETAAAMGWRVDEQRPEWGSLPDPIARYLDREPPRTFAEYLRAVTRAEEVRACAEDLATGWAAELEQVPDGGRLLMISHAGVIELGAVGAVPELAARWGDALAPLEGVRLSRAGGRWLHGEVARVDR
jgi:hypothetical protein